MSLWSEGVKLGAESWVKVSMSISFMLAWVRVPVLSVIISVVEPNVSAAVKLRIIPFFLAILVTPIARIAVIPIGNASGTEPTKTAMEIISISWIG